MSGNVYPVPDTWRGKAWIDAKQYEDMYRRSVKDPAGFCADQAKRIDWISPPAKIKDTSYTGDVHIKWFEDGALNASLNCLDRHLQKRGNQTAILWEGDDPKESRNVTYKELHETVCRLANAMKSLGVKKGDRVTIYMPMVPETAAAMLACARIGAIHSVVFGGFSPDALVGRIQDCDSNLLITADEGLRGGRKVPLKANADAALKKCPTVKHCIELKRTGGKIGWVTGHSYIVYGPLANGAVSLMFEGVPNYPSASRFWEVCDKHEVNIIYTAPTAIRALMREGEAPVKKTSRASIHLLGTVGEPINPEAWEWYHRVVGERRCPIVDTWWQTETGGILISPLPGATALKPGSATKPLPGVQPVIVDGSGKVLEGACEGNLCIADSWPGQMRTVFRDHERFVETYFSTYKGYYFTGDGCRRDADGYYWITGRVDDVINVAGHRLGTAEVESALVAHPKVAESAVVGYPHEIKGQGIYAYVTLKAGIEPSEELRKELVQWVRKEIGPIATPDMIQWAPGLPKTRSGKIMRRILRKIAENDFSNLGDTSTLAEPAVVDDLVQHRAK